ncbi:MAG: sigma-70 family RNA polymerase sigma factor [bacterium]
MNSKEEILQQQVSQAFIDDHLILVKGVASKIFMKSKIPSGVEKEDLISWGIEGLIKAKVQYKEKKESNFKTYAYYRIQGQIMDNLRLEWKQKNPAEYARYRENIQEKMMEITENILDDKNKANRQSFEKTLNEIVTQSSVSYLLNTNDLEKFSTANTCGRDIEEAYIESTTNIWNIVNKLESAKKEVIQLIYQSNMKQNEVAEKLKVSKSKVCRVHMEALKLIKRYLELEEKDIYI